MNVSPKPASRLSSKLPLYIRLAAGALLLAALPLQAQTTYTWQGDNAQYPKNWTNSLGDNWSPVGIPAANDTALFDSVDSGNRNIGLYSSVKLKSLQFTQTTHNQNWLTLGTNVTLDVTDKITLNSTARAGNPLIRILLPNTSKIIARGGMEVKSRSQLQVTLPDSGLATFEGNLEMNNFGTLSFFRAGKEFATLAILGDLTFGNNGYFSPTGSGFRKITLSGNFVAKNAHITLVMGNETNHDHFEGSGANSSFSISGGKLSLNLADDFDYSKSYQIFKNFGSGTASDVNIISYNNVEWLASLGDDGVLSFTAVP